MKSTKQCLVYKGSTNKIYELIKIDRKIELNVSEIIFVIAKVKIWKVFTNIWHALLNKD